MLIGGGWYIIHNSQDAISVTASGLTQITTTGKDDFVSQRS